MLNIPENINKPQREDYKVTEIDNKFFQQSRKELEQKINEREKSNKKKALFFTFIIIWFISFFLLNIVADKELNWGATIFVTTVIAGVLTPVIGGIVYSGAEKTIDAVTYEPRIGWSPNQNATKAYNDALNKYNKTIELLKIRYPNIEKVDYNKDKYTRYVIDELSFLINQKFDRENLGWWRNQSVNFKSCIIKIIERLGYEQIQINGLLSDIVNAFHSNAYDISAIFQGDNVLIRCYKSSNGDITIKQIKELQDSLSSFNKSKALFVTNYSMKDIPEDVKEYARLNDITIWDIYKLLELTTKLFFKATKEPPIELPDGFIHKTSYMISRSIGDGLLNLKTYHYYIYSYEIFESYKDALTAIPNFPKANIYYGVCEYPRIWQNEGNIHVYGIIACYSEDGTAFRMAKECGYMFDAKNRDFIDNKHQDNLGRRSKFIPFFI